MATPDIDFSALYSRHLDFVWRNLRALGVPMADLEDATQDTFVVAYRRRDDFRPGASMRAWLYGIARRVAYRARRGTGRRARLVDAVAAEPERAPSLEAAAEDQQAWEIAVAFLDTLPEAQREAYWLTEIEGLTAAQAGAALGVSGNTISSRLRAARQAVARHGEVMRARDVGELQRAMRRGAGPSPAQRRSAAAALGLRLGALTKVAAPLGGFGLWIGAAAAAVAITVGVAKTDRDDFPPKTIETQEVTSTATAASVVPQSAPAPAPAIPDPPQPEAVASAFRPEKPRRLAKPSTNTLAEEAELVRAIKVALNEDPQRARSLAQEHARRFPNGVLAAEAVALRVQAACALGREADAERAAADLPSGHAWASGCRSRESATNPTASGEGGGL